MGRKDLLKALDEPCKCSKFSLLYFHYTLTSTYNKDRSVLLPSSLINVLPYQAREVGVPTKLHSSRCNSDVLRSVEWSLPEGSRAGLPFCSKAMRSRHDMSHTLAGDFWPCSIFYRVIHSCHTLAWVTKYVLVVVHDVHVMSLCSCHDSIHIVQCMSRESCHVCHACMSFLSGHHSCSCHIIYVMHACHAMSGHVTYVMSCMLRKQRIAIDITEGNEKSSLHP